MSSELEKKRVQFRASRGLADRADTLIAVFKIDRTDILISALREYSRDAARSDEVKQEVAEAYCGDAVTFGELKFLVDHEEAANFHPLKQQSSKVFVDDMAEELVDT